MKQKKLDIWKDVLEKNFKTTNFPNATTINKNSEYTVQLFELLVAETLNLHDSNIKWEVTQSGHDHGIDFIGHDLNDAYTPFIKNPINLISLGQVKRKTSSYRYDDFKNDLFKVNEYCKNSDFFKQNSLKQFLFVLSSNKKNSIHNIQTRFQEDHESMLKMIMISYVGFIDAHEIFMSWKNNYSYFEKIINKALSPEQLNCFKEFVNSIEGNWLTFSLSSPKEAIVNMPIEQILTIQTDNVNLGMDIYIKWNANANYDIQLLHPLPMADPRKKGYFLHISGKKNIKLLFRSHQCGEIDLGEIKIYSSENQFIAKTPLNSLTIKEGLSFYYYYKPNFEISQKLKNILVQTDELLFFPLLIFGEGGIGKSTLISESYAYAVQQEYMAFDIAQPKDQQHNRFIINKLFRSIINAEDEEFFFEYSIVVYIRKFLGTYFNEDWTDALSNYFIMENSQINVSDIADCLVTCIIKMACKSGIFIWFSDLQWASPETITILKIVMNDLYSNKSLLQNKVVIIFEGRKNEYISLNNRRFYPAHWEDFTENYLLDKYEIKRWSEQESYEFLKLLFNIEPADEPIYEKYINEILYRSKGNPMHMLESVRYLLEKKKISFNLEHKIVILNNDLSDLYEKNIYEIITKRIMYYQKNYGNYIDILIIQAKIMDLNPMLYQNLINKFCCQYDNIQEVENESAFGSWKNGKYYFAHENYLVVFRNLKISNEQIIVDSIDFYSKLEDNTSKLSTVILKRNLSNYNLVELYHDIISLLQYISDVHIRMELYMMLLDMPGFSSEKEIFPRVKVLFELAELNVQDGNWENGLSYMKDVCKISNGFEYENILYKLKAKQEMANILADMLMFDKAINVAIEGIELAEIYIEYNEFSEEQVYSLKNEYQKLYARLAVCYWFAGNTNKAGELQQKAYVDAQKIENQYMCARVLYEIGTLQFHWNIELGLESIARAKIIGKNCPELKNEKTLIEVQLLIGRLMKSIKELDFEVIDQIYKYINFLLDNYRTVPYVYEKFLCYTMQGICLIEKGDCNSAMNSFLNSLKCADESHMSNLEWKALFNIMQLNLICENQSSAFMYAQRAYDILKTAICKNPICKIDLEDMLKPILNQLDSIINGGNCVSYDKSKILSITYNNYLFVIMN